MWKWINENDNINENDINIINEIVMIMWNNNINDIINNINVILMY